MMASIFMWHAKDLEGINPQTNPYRDPTNVRLPGTGRPLPRLPRDVDYGICSEKACDNKSDGPFHKTAC